MVDLRGDLSQRQIFTLLTGNSLLLGGVLFAGWSPSIVVFLYWCETVIIGLWNVPKVYLARGGSAEYGRIGSIAGTLFFVAHYGGFVTMLGWIVWNYPAIVVANTSVTGVPTLGTSLARQSLSVGVALSGLLVVHGSLFVQGLWNDRYAAVPMKRQTGRPYPRVVTLHVLVLGLLFALPALATGPSALVLVILLKAVGDVLASRLDFA